MSVTISNTKNTGKVFAEYDSTNTLVLNLSGSRHFNKLNKKSKINYNANHESMSEFPTLNKSGVSINNISSSTNKQSWSKVVSSIKPKETEKPTKILTPTKPKEQITQNTMEQEQIPTNTNKDTKPNTKISWSNIVSTVKETPAQQTEPVIPEDKSIKQYKNITIKAKTRNVKFENDDDTIIIDFNSRKDKNILKHNADNGDSGDVEDYDLFWSKTYSVNSNTTGDWSDETLECNWADVHTPGGWN